MKPDPDRIRDLFVAALGATGPSGWGAFLEGECRGDRDLLVEVRQLLEAHLEAGGLLEAPALAVADAAGLLPAAGGPGLAAGAAGPGAPGPVIGPYRLLEVIGEGGMGVVYGAEQERPVRRRVALKVIEPGMDTRQVSGRLERNNAVPSNLEDGYPEAERYSDQIDPHLPE
jgi:hypothetical protein